MTRDLIGYSIVLIIGLASARGMLQSRRRRQTRERTWRGRR
jgi:hypothetical protein